MVEDQNNMMSEDEALAKALKMSLVLDDPPSPIADFDHVHAKHNEQSDIYMDYDNEHEYNPDMRSEVEQFFDESASLVDFENMGALPEEPVPLYEDNYSELKENKNCQNKRVREYRDEDYHKDFQQLIDKNLEELDKPFAPNSNKLLKEMHDLRQQRNRESKKKSKIEQEEKKNRNQNNYRPKYQNKPKPNDQNKIRQREYNPRLRQIYDDSGVRSAFESYDNADSVDKAMFAFAEQFNDSPRGDRDVGFPNYYHNEEHKFRPNGRVRRNQYNLPIHDINNEQHDNMNIDNANYEQLLELEERMGKVSKGYQEDEISNIPVLDVCEGDEYTDCAICIDKIKKGDKKYLIPCDHDFHVDCLKENLKISKKCPVCQVDVI